MGGRGEEKRGNYKPVQGRKCGLDRIDHFYLKNCQSVT